MTKKIDWKWIKYIYQDVYKPPEAVTSILREEGLSNKQIKKCIKKRDKWLDENY